MDQGRFLYREPDDIDLPKGMVRDTKIDKKDLVKSMKNFPRFINKAVNFETFSPTPTAHLYKNGKVLDKLTEGFGIKPPEYKHPDLHKDGQICKFHKNTKVEFWCPSRQEFYCKLCAKNTTFHNGHTDDISLVSLQGEVQKSLI
jgi:hypothetical protein